MHRLIALAVLLCVACGDKTEPPPEPTPDAGTEVREATLIVHSDWWNLESTFGVVKGITVLLGDGSRFRQPLGRDGIARFEDPAITGPQDITVVIAGENKVVASTTLAMEGKEVWIRAGVGLLTSVPSSLQATLTGRVTNLRGSPAELRVVGEGFHNLTTYTTVDGTFRLDVLGANPGKVALFVLGSTGGVRTYGLLRDIAVGGARTVSDLVIPMDRVMDQRLPVEVTNVQPYEAVKSVVAFHRLGSTHLWSAVGTATPPFEVPTLARTPPFDTVELVLSVSAGAYERVSSGFVAATTPMVDGGLTTLALPAPMSLTSPTPGTFAAPGSAPRSGLTLGWSTDPAAHVVTVRLTPLPLEGEPRLHWYLTAPATVSGFAPFTLPAEVSELRELSAGHYRLEWSSHFLGTGHGYPEFLAPAPPPTGPDAWFTSTYGSVILQD
ncbi:hypothetical protein JYK02_38425 [Corallococcus macrosporus]|uniref:Carboxypeptidase regulatory-like domain-containing protein n=1 Tax=Corallococcus macrosporus TaxID=35 RepID=A0ABS3DPZ2_9BACT|nr:hypothetical protein [Corallococcus macrosporus]MBN8233411.1 hypothetical protein [Corallococcus macrosporus]